MNLKRKLRMGMVGGGRGAFIGTVHRMAAALDGRLNWWRDAFQPIQKNRKSQAMIFFSNLLAFMPRIRKWL